MTIKIFRYFFSFFETQEKWLNKMAAQGWRLVRTTKLFYEFESCKPSEYEYCVEFVGDKSYKEAKEYKSFLEEMGFRTFTKNININYSFGKIRWRPWARGGGQIATSPGGYNKEILLLEKKNDGKPFELHTDYNDLIRYYRPIRNAYLCGLLLPLFMVIGNYVFDLFMVSINLYEKILVAIVALVLTIPIYKYSALIKKYKSILKINE